MKLLHSLLFFCSLFACLLGLNPEPIFAQEPTPQIATNTVKTEEKSTEPKAEISPKTEEKTADFSTGNYSTATITNRVGVQTAQTITLSLNEAIRKALENNNDIEVARDEVRFQETQLRSLLGAYDPTFSVTPYGSGASSKMPDRASFSSQHST